MPGEIVGGEDKIDREREYLTGDNFIANFGSEYWKTVRVLVDRNRFPVLNAIASLTASALCRRSKGLAHG
jgi:hypothetical protein